MSLDIRNKDYEGFELFAQAIWASNRSWPEKAGELKEEAKQAKRGQPCNLNLTDVEDDARFLADLAMARGHEG